MVYLIILSFVLFLIAFAINLIITFFLVKFFNRTAGFWTIFKPILFYQLGVFCFFFVKPTGLIYILDPIIPRRFLLPIVLLATVIILFLIFKFIMQKFSLLDFKKSLIVFFLMFLIITPAISFFRQIIELKIAEKLPISSANQYNLQEMMQQFFFPSAALKSPSQIIYEKMYGLNDIFLEGEFLKNLRQFIITF